MLPSAVQPVRDVHGARCDLRALPAERLVLHAPIPLHGL
ncbi:hypothetical protein S1361_05455 [Streptomyces cyanogenus]|uniref:Uncharacterized protein n=1 Tax=Streptomyces cyanogenus TaxID=80860 RepID=A0ABX7TJM6_STRCY|nr:hypothetical protein S1361_05455 [Streptomyces cyanogenus]